MRFRGGYKIMLEGRPDRSILSLPDVNKLYVPLHSRRFTFSEICVKDGQTVGRGDILAKDPLQYAVPLLAPLDGTVHVKTVEGHIELDKVTPHGEEAHAAETHPPHILQEMGAAGIKRYKLLTLGAWEYFSDAYTGLLPDPLGTPQAIIVSMMNLEPYVTRGDALLHDRLLSFTRGLEQLQSLLEYQPIYLVMPDIRSDFASQVREHLRGYVWVKLVEIPSKYPYDHFTILARSLGLKQKAGPIWCVRVEGVLAIDTALTAMKPCVEKIISIAGPVVRTPTHIKVMTGYPIRKILETFVSDSAIRIINGGMLTGVPLSDTSVGLEAECMGLTILPELKQREFLGFVRPGWDRHSYSSCFLSSVRAEFVERLTTAVRGEGRPCISCGYCEEVCPAGIMPYQLHKYLYSDLIEEADQAGIHHCVECGLCSFVCPSKIELREQFREAKRVIEQEKKEVKQAEEKRLQKELQEKKGCSVC